LSAAARLPRRASATLAEPPFGREWSATGCSWSSRSFGSVAVLEFGLRGARLLCPAEERHWLPWEARDNEWTLYQYDSAARLEEPAGRLRLVLDAGLADARRDQLAGAARRRAWPPRTATVRGDRLYSRWRLALT